ncbi:MAG TPA: tetratricopeptide repeat protein [Patescibacteria group bacterium]
MKKDWFNELFLKGYNAYYWITGLGFFTYIWTIFFGFTYFDDKTLILDNLYFLKNLGNIPTAFTTEVFHVLHASAAYYRPLLTISYMIDAQFSGNSGFFYHFTDIIIHLIASCLVYLFLTKLKIRKELAFLFSAIFAVHPVLSQGVVWLPGRNDSLLAVFVLSSFIFFIRFLDSQKTKDLVWHLAFFALAIFTKESAVLLPPMIVLYLILFVKTPIRSIKLNYVLTWIGIYFVWFILRAIALTNPIHYGVLDVSKSLIRDLPAIALHFGKAMFPVNLSVLPILQDSNFIYGYVSIALVLILLAFSKGRNNKMVLFGIAWFLVFLVPSFVRPDPNYVADFLEHRIYLPIIGIFLILSEIEFIKKLDFLNKKIVFVLSTIIVIFTALNFIHTAKFRDKLVFWQNAVIDAPHHPLAHKNLGAMYYLHKNFDQAEKQYKLALELNPQEVMTHNNLGLIYMERKDYVKAEDEYKKELEINPLYDNAFFNYGILLYATGRADDAEKFWLKTLQINPDYIDAMKNLLILYSAKKDTEHAQYYYNQLQARGIQLNY